MSSKKESKKVQSLEPLEITREEHKQIIDEYYVNGYNGVKAVQALRPGIQYNTARQVFNQLKKKDHVKKYIAEKVQSLRASTNIKGEQILRELLQYAYSDATQYIGLTPEEVKQLPPDVRRSIQSIKHRKKSYKDRNGKQVTEEVIEVRIVDKLKAIDMINKHIGLYSEDNKQKQVKLNIQDMNIHELKVLQNILIKADQPANN